MNEQFHKSITIFPSGSIFAGERDTKENFSEKSFSGKERLGNYVWNKSLSSKVKGLVAKTNTIKEQGALMAKVMNTPYDIHGLIAADSIANSENLTHLQ